MAYNEIANGIEGLRKGDYAMQKKKRIIRLLFGSCLFATALLCGGCGGASAVAIEDLRAVPEETVADASAAEEGAGAAQDGGDAFAAEPETIFVQVNGAVISPGVYPMEEGGRVFEAIEKAGGLTEEAAAEALNQAAVVSDGQVITVYTYQEWEERRSLDTALSGEDMQGQDTMEDGRVNINTADLDTLCTIPGIGRTRAEHIISYRSENGPFECIEDIKKVSGIKEGLFDQIKDMIKV